ncbi:MAG: hypothetical protein GTN81_14390 [Proteobacteria bacterium]|nr:hypothetical protein [Pseudomonadota bacterium]
MDQFKQDRRNREDRRQGTTKPISRYIATGRRSVIRRERDQQTHVYVDRYGHKLLVALLIIVLLSVFDTYFTIYHVERGAREINPFMDFLLGYGNIYFFATKYVLTAFGIFLLCIYKNVLFVRIIIVSIIFIYLTVFSYHVLLALIR